METLQGDPMDRLERDLAEEEDFSLMIHYMQDEVCPNEGARREAGGGGHWKNHGSNSERRCTTSAGST